MQDAISRKEGAREIEKKEKKGIYRFSERFNQVKEEQNIPIATLLIATLIVIGISNVKYITGNASEKLSVRVVIST